MIHTLTLNTAIDMNIFCDPLQPAAVNRTRQTEYCPNGKGVNVSLVLHHYQQPTHVMGIFGGFTGRYIVEELRKQHINVTPAWVAEPTRIKEGANKQVISSQADSLIKISRIWADFFPANTSN